MQNFDGLSDIVMGMIIDKTKTRWGKARPWLLFMGLPLILPVLLVFFVPTAFSEDMKEVYIAVTYFLMSVICYTAVNLAYHSMLPRFSLTSEDRCSVSAVRSVFSMMATLVVATITPSIIGKFGGFNSQSAWTTTVLLYGMHYKDIYYEEAEKQNKEVQKLKHDMKHKLHELYHLLENSDGHELSEKIGAMCIEFEQIDEKQYSDNPIVDSVLRIKFGRAKARGIKVETSIRIPKQMQLDHGDIGVLYGNLVDNAVEACSKVPEGQRFVKIENKYQSGILLLVITNSKTGKKNKSLKTTKKDNIRHGHGVQSVRKVIEKYNGTVSFTDKGDIFEVSAMLYGIEVKE